METTNNATAGNTPASGNSDYQTLAGFIYESQKMLTNAQLSEIQTLLAKRGYSKKMLEDKLAELEALNTLNKTQQKEYGEQYAATEAFAKAKTDLHAEYKDHLKLARMVLEDDTAAQKTLGLNGKRQKSKSGYITQALQFYEGVLESGTYRAALAAKGVEGEELEAAQKGYTRLKQLAAAQAKETGEAQEATAQRDAAYDALTKWMNEFKATAAIALRKTPALLVALGL